MESDEKTLPDKKNLKCIVLHNFTNTELSKIIAAVKSLYATKEERRTLVFSKTTETSLKMGVGELIEDVSGDHLYLMENPPDQSTHEEALKKQAASPPEQS